MSTLSSIARISSRTVFLAVPLIAAGALAAGCASAHSTAGAAGPVASSTGPAQAASSATSTPTPRSAPGSAPASPVPTVSGGQAAPGEPYCAGWPTADTATVSLPVSFVPVSVERCVHGAESIPGKGLWTTATLQRSDSDLTALINALREPPAPQRKGTACPMIAVIPQQVVLINASGEKLIPRLPVSGCGLVQSQVLAALNALHWQTVSVRLIAKIDSTQPTVSGTAPHSIQTVGGAPSS